MSEVEEVQKALSEAEATVLSVPEKEQIRVALIYICRILEKIAKELERLNEQIANTISVEVYRGDSGGGMVDEGLC